MPNRKSNAGRKSKLTKDEVNALIHLFRTEKQFQGHIKYLDMYRFNKEKFEENAINSLAGEDFWRKENRLGRQLIDQANKVFSHQLSTVNSEKINIPNLIDCVNRYHNQKNKLIKELLPLEKAAINSIEDTKKLHAKLLDAEDKLKKSKEENLKLIQKIDILQEVVFKMFRYGAIDEIPIADFLQIKNPQSQLVNNALNNVFDSPIAFLEELNKKEELLGSQANTKTVRLADKIKERFR